MRINYQQELNTEQYQVVTEADGPCLVLAGAGSGKTRTLIYRVAYLLEKGIPPAQILLVTFTNKAAREMQNRIERLLGRRPVGLWCGTFHHVGNRSLRMYSSALGLTESFGILDEEDSANLIKACIRSLEIKITEERFPRPGIVQAIISYATNSQKTIRDTLEERYPYFRQFTARIEEIQRLYEKRKQRSNNLDYDDLLTRWIWMLRNVPAAEERFTGQFRYILVDEYQDTNRLQYEIIQLLSARHRNVLAVGDDAQSIYSFRAAEIRNILDFPQAFPGTKIFRLETNYRSTPEILHLANESIGNNVNQFPKTLKAVCGSGEKPFLIQIPDLATQAAFLTAKLLELREEGVPLEEMAVLFRSHYQSAELELELSRRNIPYVVRGGIRFFEQAHIKDALAFLRILENPRDELSWLRALTLQPGIGGGYADRIFSRFIQSGASLPSVVSPEFGKDLSAKVSAGLAGFRKIMRAILPEELRRHPDALVEEVVKEGYRDYVLVNFDNSQDRILDLQELANFGHGYKNLGGFLNDITLREGFRGETVLGAAEEDEFLVISTIHQAKGLEWRVVMLVGLSDGDFPHPKSLERPEQVEEERRLFYVACTRAKQKLYLFHPLSRFDYGRGLIICRPSQFLQELPPDSYRLERPEPGENYFTSGDKDGNIW